MTILATLILLKHYSHVWPSPMLIPILPIRCNLFFFFIGREPTMWPANNCLQIMFCSCAMSSSCNHSCMKMVASQDIYQRTNSVTEGWLVEKAWHEKSFIFSLLFQWYLTSIVFTSHRIYTKENSFQATVFLQMSMKFKGSSLLSSYIPYYNGFIKTTRK